MAKRMEWETIRMKEIKMLESRKVMMNNQTMDAG